MKNAKEMEAIAVQVMQESETRKMNRAMGYAEEVIGPAIEDAAKHGKREAPFTKTRNIEWHFLKSYLEQNGFTVHSSMGSYTVCW